MSVIKFVVYVKIIFSKVFDKSWITLLSYVYLITVTLPHIYISPYIYIYKALLQVGIVGRNNKNLIFSF